MIYESDRIFECEKDIKMFSSAKKDEEMFTIRRETRLDRDCSKSIHFGARPHYCDVGSIESTIISLVTLPRLFAALLKPRLIDKDKCEFHGWASRGMTSLECAW